MINLIVNILFTVLISVFVVVAYITQIPSVMLFATIIALCIIWLVLDNLCKMLRF